MNGNIELSNAINEKNKIELSQNSSKKSINFDMFDNYSQSSVHSHSQKSFN